VVADWPSLSTAIQIQSGPSQFDNLRLDGLDDYVLLDCFISGLIPELKLEVIS